MQVGERLNLSEKKHGHYLGTEIDEKWWRRYYRDGLLARGIGKFWIDASALFFQRKLTNTPIVIPLDDVLDVKVGKWHSGRWAWGALVVKILWQKAGRRLSSGFVFSYDTHETDTLVQDIRSHIRQAADNVQRAGTADIAKQCDRRGRLD